VPRPVDLLVHPIGELATPDCNGPARGHSLGKIKRYRDAAIAVSEGKIVAAGPAQQVLSQIDATEAVVVDASRKVVTPGLVDPHTHLVFEGNRSNEFLMRCAGKTYAEIANAGGGIVASMSATRNATLEALVTSGRKRLRRMLATGTTTCEVKTGYGLDADSELRMLQAIMLLAQTQQCIDLIPTFMPAHAFPPKVDRQEYIDSIVNDMLPRAAQLVEEAGSGRKITLYNDVFCDQGYFTLDETRTILEAGLKVGCKPKVHSDEFVSLGATALAAEMGAASADHLLNISDEDIARLAASNTVAVLLPGTSFFLNLKDHAPARKMIDKGAIVALGTDFNPGSCHISSLPFIWGLACLHLKMSVEEALSALTINAAYAVGRGDTIGQLTPGKAADIVLYEVDRLEEIPYNVGWNPVCLVIKNGRVVYQKNAE
jgi:imidazolonepropionase